ncbi:class I SAM-dependent methyltransferase [Arthrobacter roseus]|uniref:class I SAM-dependent methyltransferase n=1 Tax=Arthrobacter roseus TaxID=136274 RepID=UPI0019644DD2|nr:class I SAM-dependent methyltransferase [Arthrobacter roseus]MBM7849758.1 2-polyprenyl-3-methyl-5-hydroxy-6-metoxy-1,4-benzoquinol methylase [Arthrobacter roseus]
MIDNQADYWDRQAATFDQDPDHGLEDPDVRTAWRNLLKQILPKPPSKIADMGCGTGALTELLAQDGHELVGLDISPQMVKTARQKLNASGVEARLEVRDVADPRLRSGTYDVVLSRHVVWALPDKVDAIDTWFRLLRPGGRIVLIEGRWSTGGGMSMQDLASLLEPHAPVVHRIPLSDPQLWGRTITDERYALVGEKPLD